MDLNPYQFTAPFEAKEFANAMLPHSPGLILCSNAWLMGEEEEADDKIDKNKANPALLNYWCERLSPLLESTTDGERVIVVAISNRTGKEGNSRFGGSSCVILCKDGKASLKGALSIDQVGVRVVEVL
jgi:protein N-terminal amidase